MGAPRVEHSIALVSPSFPAFEARYIPEPNSGCWLWLGSINPSNGYGRMRLKGDVQIYAHKFSFLFHKGPIPDGKLLRHTCDMKCCVNPEHIIPGNALDNAADAVARGLYPVCEKHGMATLTRDTVLAIYSAQGTVSAVSRKFNISRMHVTRIKNKETWRTVLCAL